MARNYSWVRGQGVWAGHSAGKYRASSEIFLGGVTIHRVIFGFELWQQFASSTTPPVPPGARDMTVGVRLVNTVAGSPTDDPVTSANTRDWMWVGFYTLQWRPRAGGSESGFDLVWTTDPHQESVEVQRLAATPSDTYRLWWLTDVLPGTAGGLTWGGAMYSSVLLSTPA